MEKTQADSGEGWFTRERTLVLVLAAITIVAFYLCYLLVVPFIPALAWAVAIAVVAHPLHEWLQRRIRARSLVAGLAVAIVTTVVVVPTAFIVHQVSGDAAESAEKVKGDIEKGRWRQLAEKSKLTSAVLRWVEQEVDIRAQIERVTKEVLSGAGKVITRAAYIVTGFLIMLFLLFYFFRDKEKLLASVRRSVPLSLRESERLFKKIQDTIYAIVYGTVMVAVVQGALGGLMFWLLGLPSPLLWGTIMALLAILPILGAALVWVPAAILLAIDGSWDKALILTAWGAIVVSLIDNLLYPIFVKSRLRMHTVPVFIAVIGGLIAFGGAGVVLGPVVLAIAVGLADVWRGRLSDGTAAEEGPDAENAAPDKLPSGRPDAAPT